LIAGDEIVIMPAGKIAKIKSVESWPLTPVSGRQTAGRSVGITLDRELFIQRGDLIARTETAPRDTGLLRARIFWLHDTPLNVGASVILRLGTSETRAKVMSIAKAIDPGDLIQTEKISISRNTVGEIGISLAQPLAVDTYQQNPRTGRIVIEMNGRVAGGGPVLSVEAAWTPSIVDIVPVLSSVGSDERMARARHAGAVVWFTGLPASGKSTLARGLERRLFDRGGSPILLDGDTFRNGLNKDLGFSAVDRTENIRRLAEVAAHLARNGQIAIVAAVSPAAEDRAQARLVADGMFREIFVATPANVCESRDPKGHYAKGRAGALKGFTGIGNDYEQPVAPVLTLDTSTKSLAECIDDLERMLVLTQVLRD